jgi:hypothetical protein
MEFFNVTLSTVFKKDTTKTLYISTYFDSHCIIRSVKYIRLRYFDWKGKRQAANCFRIPCIIIILSYDITLFFFYFFSRCFCHHFIRIIIKHIITIFLRAAKNNNVWSRDTPYKTNQNMITIAYKNDRHEATCKKTFIFNNPSTKCNKYSIFIISSTSSANNQITSM